MLLSVCQSFVLYNFLYVFLPESFRMIDWEWLHGSLWTLYMYHCSVIFLGWTLLFSTLSGVGVVSTTPNPKPFSSSWFLCVFRTKGTLFEQQISVKFFVCSPVEMHKIRFIFRLRYFLDPVILVINEMPPMP